VTAELTLGPYVTGEKPAPLQYQFQDSDGVAIDLSGYTVDFNVSEQYGAPSTFTGSLVTGGTTGWVQYTWTGNEWPTSGRYFAQFWVGNGTNRFASLRMEFDVAQPVGVVPSI